MSASTPAPRVAVEERLFSLVLALLATEGGLSKSEILSTVQGYRQRYVAGGDNANLERQFERDKDDIRELGVPLETIEAPGDAGNNQTLRYRIRKGAYELPTDVRFTAEETSMLNLAAMVWREGALSGESRRALLKLRGIGADTPQPVLGYQPRVRSRDAAFAALDAALEKHLMVRFQYLKPGQTAASDRNVIPLALVQYQGRWHLSAEEPDTGRRKMFLLRRIVGPVATGRAAPPRDGDFAAEALASLAEVWQDGVAEVEVVAGSDAERRLGHRPGAERVLDDAAADPRLRLHYVDLAILADELAAFGPEVLVLAPPELRSAVRQRLTAIGDAHAEA
ncbi:YafY family protein [Schumannella sp. 10F1B-5-1]|uniref:helix-turn-helix transcriptional regulator n=1 Tax=Schumannella sp. 10F1B-5-1 TaxID=2590780 RepID=UPI0011325D3F|nr:WYL domain-containing protein [Schumannella sp. 10F1B-5-1]TPW70922.1 WYL domain-containing protein [Schumannella sp. 10F1B-5-1]